MNGLTQLNKNMNVDEFVGYAQRRANEDDSLLCHSDIVKTLEHLNSFLEEKELSVKSDKIIFNNIYEKIIDLYSEGEIDEAFFASVFDSLYKLEEKMKGVNNG